MSIKNHIILNHIDEPIKILFWTKGELCLFFLPFMWGVLSDEFVLGLIISGFNSWVISFYKKTFGKGKLQAVMYWFLPHNPRLKSLPPSFIRFYLG